MRIGIGLLVALMVVMAGTAYGDVIAFRDGGDNSGASTISYGGTTFSEASGNLVNLAFDDTWTGAASVSDDINGGANNMATRTDTHKNRPLIGFAGVFEELPAGATITGAHILLYNSNSWTAYYDVEFTVRRVTTDWLFNAAGSNEMNVSGDFKNVATTTDWDGTVIPAPPQGSPGVFDGQHWTTTNQVVYQANEAAAGTLQDIDITALVQDMFAAGQDYGISIERTLGKLVSNDGGIGGSSTLSFHSSNASLANIGFRPVILLEYTTVPEPGTMLLVGSGVLGLVGVIRRRRMA